MTPAQWNALFDQRVALWPHLEAEVKSLLEFVDYADPISTRDLMEALWPRQFAVGDGIKRREQLTKVLLERGKTHLTGWYTRESMRMQFGRETRPFLWHAPRPANVCPHCGGLLDANV